MYVKFNDNYDRSELLEAATVSKVERKCILE